MLLAIAMILFCVSFITGNAQAPGDEDGRCKTRRNRPSVINQEILMWSFHYNDLIEKNGPWIVLDEDDNNDGRGIFTTQTRWTQSGASCERVTSVCGFEFGTQNNWLITQFINNTLRQEDVYIKVTFAINSYCTTGCQTTLDMYVLQTNETDQNFVRNISVFENSTVFVLTDNITDGSILIIRTLIIPVDLYTSGLFVAFRDQGACIGISEVVVYYPVCDSMSLDFGANFLTRQFPGGSSVGSCFTNMSIDLTSTNDSFNATCSLSTSSNNEIVSNWTINGDPSGCMCLPGYMFTSHATTEQCEACPPFTFKNTLSNTDVCQPCPLFSNTTDSDTAAAVCPCDPGYHRTDSEDATQPCTREACLVSEVTGRVKHNSRLRRTRITFSSDGDSSVTYRCKLDNKRFKNCKSPRFYKNLSEGKHRVVVRASCVNNTSTAKRRFQFRIRPSV